MEKSLDGIKKLNPADLKKYRKIVLNYIGEEDAAEVNKPRVFTKGAVSSKKVDSIKANKISDAGRQGEIVSKELSAKGGRLSNLFGGRTDVSGGKQEESVEKSSNEEIRLREAIKRQEAAREKIKAEERQYQMKEEQAEKDRSEREERGRQEKIRLEQEKAKQEKIKQEEIKKQVRELAEKKRRDQAEAAKQEELNKKEIVERTKRGAEEIKRATEIKEHEEKIRLEELEKEKKFRVKEALRLKKIKREKEISRIKQEMKMAKQAIREKKKIKRQKAWKSFKRNFTFRARLFYFFIKRNIIYIILLLTLGLAIIYAVFCLLVLRFNTDNNIISQAANYLPVPAVITSQGIISYLDYKKIEDNNYLGLSLAEKKNYLAEWLILRGLKEKYGLAANSSVDNLAIKYALDKDFNQSGISRINKINELLNSQNAIEQLGKYADEYNGGVYYDANSAVEKFGPAVLGLAIGQTGEVIPRAEGYYILKRIDDKNSQLGLKYLFIRAETLNQYVSEKLAKIKIFILAD